MRPLSLFDWIALVLLLIGGLNWGLIGFFNFDFIGFIFAHAIVFVRIIYALVGLSAIWVIIKLSKRPHMSI